MGILKKAAREINAKDFTKKKVFRASKRVPKGSGDTADQILQDPAEVQRLSTYITESEGNKIVDIESGITHGVDQIGTINDTNEVLRDLLRGATDQSKRIAARTLVKKWAVENLVDVIETKTGEVIGRQVSKNIYIKEVSYKRKGKTISYLQARSSKTGRVVKMATAKRLLGKTNKFK